MADLAGLGDEKVSKELSALVGAESLVGNAVPHLWVFQPSQEIIEDD